MVAIERKNRQCDTRPINIARWASTISHAGLNLVDFNHIESFACQFPLLNIVTAQAPERRRGSMPRNCADLLGHIAACFRYAASASSMSFQPSVNNVHAGGSVSRIFRIQPPPLSRLIANFCITNASNELRQQFTRAMPSHIKQ